MSNLIAQDYARQIDEIIGGLIQEMRGFQGDPAQLYQHPIIEDKEEWSMMENLAHIAEFPPYWAKAMLKVVENPGQPFGRTHTDPARIAAVAEHAKDELTKALTRIETARFEANQLFLHINDEQWDKTGLHANRGEMNLRQVIDAFVIKHLRDHVDQAKTALQTRVLRTED